MFTSTQKGSHGFTIVELAIVIVVIGILAAIAVVSYNGVQQRAYNTKSSVAIQKWADAFELYRGSNFSKLPPLMGKNDNFNGVGYCLGTGFPNNRCRLWKQPTSDPQSYGEAGFTDGTDSENLKQAFESKNIDIPEGHTDAISGTVGPYLVVFANGTTPTPDILRAEITAPFYGSTSEMAQLCANFGLVQAWPGNGSGYGTCKLVIYP